MSNNNNTKIVSRRDCLKTIALAAAAVPFAANPASADTPKKDTLNIDTPPQPGTHRILTCNILLDLSEHTGKFDWNAHRGETCIQIIKSHKPDIFCMQEVGKQQNKDFIRAFPDFATFGYVDPYVDKEPKRFQSCKNVIMYKRDRYELISEATYWLSETPEIAGSRLPDDGLPRHVTWVRLKDKQSGKQFRVMDTHWTLTQPERMREAEIIAAESRVYRKNFPQIICGDFNSDRTAPEHKVIEDIGWKDTYETVHGAKDPGSTGHDMDGVNPHPQRGKIDFIFFRGKVEPVAAKIIKDNFSGQYPSDHFFVSADVTI